MRRRALVRAGEEPTHFLRKNRGPQTLLCIHQSLSLPCVYFSVRIGILSMQITCLLLNL
jgi:hypothetical protein